MRIIVLSLILFCCGTCPITAQSDYIVTTPSTQEIPVGELPFTLRDCHAAKLPTLSISCMAGDCACLIQLAATLCPSPKTAYKNC